jgi:hypothetical protein
LIGFAGSEHHDGNERLAYSKLKTDDQGDSASLPGRCKPYFKSRSRSQDIHGIGFKTADQIAKRAEVA